MTIKRFAIETLLLFAITVFLASLVSWAGSFEGFLELYLYAALVFVIFNVFIFFYGYTTSQSDQLFSFNNVVSASFLIKLIMSIGFLLLWERLFDPNNNMHVLNYIVVYVIFTVHEVYFLTKLAKPKG